MKLKTIKDTNNINYNSFSIELESIGYSVQKKENIISLEPMSFSKILSSLGLIYIVQEIKAHVNENNIIIEALFNRLVLGFYYFCAVMACFFMIQSQPKLDPIKIIMTFGVLVLFLSLIVLFLLRLEILRDIKRALRA